MAELIPLNISQRNIYYANELYAGKPVYTLHITMAEESVTDAEQLCRAVNTVLKKVPCFRFSVVDNHGEPFFHINDECDECTLEHISDSELDNILEKQKYAYIPLSGSLYEACVYTTDVGRVIFSFSVHHVLMDGFSVGLFCDEIAKAYRCGEDYEYKRQYTVGGREEVDETAFWSGYFKNVKPYVQSFPARNDYVKAGVYKTLLGAELSHKIMSFCDKHNVKPYTVFAAALAVYRMHTADTDEAFITLPRLNRDSNDERVNIGCHVLPVVIRLKGCDSFSELCKSAEKEGRLASEHKKCGYSKILDEMRKSGCDDTLAEYTLNFQKSRANIKNAKIDFSSCGAIGNLITVNISDWTNTGEFAVTYDYRTDVTDKKYMSFFHRSLIKIISAGVLENAVTADFLCEDEKALLLNTLKGKTVPLNPNDTIVSLFEKAVGWNKDKTAVAACDRKLTFGELDEMSGRIAGSLSKRGLKKGDIVAFRLSRTSRLIPIIFGILRAGCAFLPIDIKTPPQRQEYILQDSGAVCLITDENINEYINGTKAALPDITPNDLAYCIYTSGTTGKPKGVLLEHKGIVNIVNADNNPFNRDICRGGRGIAAIGSIAFDISLFEIFVTLLNGMLVALASDDEMNDARQLARLIIENGINIIHCTPTRLLSYTSYPEFETALQNIDYILSAGEVLSKALSDKLREYNIRVYNGYGPTECTIGATITEADDTVSIGTPISNTSVYILDKKHRLLPFGIVGEIAVVGIGTARGYLNRPELTAEKFITTEFGRAYLTGDLGYFSVDGRLCYIGRNDNQVKLRGLRIELSEIENCMLSIDRVESCAAIVKLINGSEHLVCFYSGANNDSPDELKKKLRQFLVYYMVPDVLVKLDQMPLTINGKTDKEKLREIETVISTEYQPPQTKEECILCDAFSSVLDIEKIGIHDNFFELGGDSLLAAELIVFANQNELSLNFADIFHYPTPELLAKHIFDSEDKNYDEQMKSEDYSRIEAQLSKNVFIDESETELGNVLLTGATGYLGCHVLDELMREPTVKTVYCLVRPSGRLTSQRRLAGKLYYYFEGEHVEKIGDRIKLINGDITNKEVLNNIEYSFDTVINCAADVSHFAYGERLMSVNTAGVKNLIELCKRQKARFIQTSTVSISGFSESIGKILTEQSLYIGQSIYNQYVYSKFKAEQLILNAASEGLDAKIMRIGNLQGRLSDGEFQMNMSGNAFASHMKGYYFLKCAPESVMAASVNFSPVDETARAIVLLSKTQSVNTVFHVISPEEIPYKTLFEHLGNVCDTEIKCVSDSEFARRVEETAKDETKYKQVKSIIIEKKNHMLKEVPVSTKFTQSALEKHGFLYRGISGDYLDKCFEALDSLAFFK